MAKFLDQDKVTEYAQVDAKYDQLKTRREELRLELIEGFEDGLKCPKEGPYLLKLTHQKRRNIKWKDEFTRLARKVWGTGWLKRKKEIENSYERTEVPMILVDVNPRYKTAEQKVTEMPKRKGAA